MLNRLLINNIVLIKKICINFETGLNVLTGETGAGKSILLDALTLALGGRADSSLIKKGETTAQVIAEFDEINDNLKEILNSNYIEYNDGLILKRTITTDGKSKAFVNDIPVSIKLLKDIGDNLVEVYGQFESHYLLNPITHRKILDDFASSNSEEYELLLSNVKESYKVLNEFNNEYKKLLFDYEIYNKEREYLEYAYKELENLNIKQDEEEKLTELRARVLANNKNKDILRNIDKIINDENLDNKIFSLINLLEKINPNPYLSEIEKLYETTNILSLIAHKINILEDEDLDIDKIEERLFKIRELSRKYNVPSNKLSYKLEEIANKLNNIQNFDDRKKQLENKIKDKTSIYLDFTKKLSVIRNKQADILRNNILKELPDLKLNQADFKVLIQESEKTEYGTDNITFYIRTNPGMDFTPLHKTISGGELSRLILAIRVVLVNDKNKKIFVFDEVDTGISGSTASSVGLRLSRLSKENQSIVITHSAQVAGYANSYFKIIKNISKDSAETNIIKLNRKDKIEEIARIISGTSITEESKKMAETLLQK